MIIAWENKTRRKSMLLFFLSIHSNSFISCSHFPRNVVLYHKTMANCLCVWIYWAFDEISKSRFQNYIPSNCTNLLLFISNEHDKVALIQRVAFMYTQNYANYTKQLAAAQIKTFCFWDEKKKRFEENSLFCLHSKCSIKLANIS